MSMFTRFASAALVLGAVALVATGCGKSADSTSKKDSSKDGPKVGLVTDIGGLNDHSFNFLANEGFSKAKKDLGATGTVIESKSAADYEKNLGQESKNGSKLVVGIGFLMGDAVKAVAAKAPDTNFAIIDFSYGEDTPPNVQGLLFKEQEAGYLAGVLAGAVEADGTLKGLNDKKIVSVVGGQEIPPVVRYIAGFKAGLATTCADCTMLLDYSQDFVDQAKCQDRALAQIQKGSDIVFQVAGQCGLGALDAAKRKGVWGIGVDADQAYLGSHILTSAMKRVDNAVFETIKSVADGKFKGGADAVFGLKEDGVGLGKTSPDAKKYQDQVDAAKKAILDGTVTVPEDIQS